MDNAYAPPPLSVMMQMINGKLVSRCISLVADLSIADLLQDGPQTASSLAETTGMNQDALNRVLRMLSAVGIFSESGEQTYQNNPLSDTLRSDVQGSLRSYARWLGTHFHWDVVGHMDFTVRTGIPAVLKDDPEGNVFEVLSKHEDAQQIFQEAMTGLSLADGHAVGETYPFSDYNRIMDVGGGHGTLAKIIHEHAPNAQISVLDLPHVIEGTKEILSIVDLQDKIKAISGSFFKPIQGPVDLIVMKHIIHDWDDVHAAKIIRNCREALSDNGRIVLCEMLVTPSPASIPAKILDIEMLVGPGGRERTREEFESLFRSAGMKLNQIIDTTTQIKLIEAIKNNEA